MEHIDPDEPLFRIYVDARHVATMCDPHVEDMFWCSYRLDPADESADIIIHDGKTWETVAFVVKDMDGNVTNPRTFSGGFYDFCDHKTDRLSFRSLWPTKHPRMSRGTRIFNAIAKVIGVHLSNKTAQNNGMHRRV